MKYHLILVIVMILVSSIAAARSDDSNVKEGKQMASQRHSEMQSKLETLLPSQKPPSPYIVERDSLPGKYCLGQEWIAPTDLELKDRPAGTRVTAKVIKGSKVNCLTVKAFVEPEPVAVVADIKVNSNTALHKGDFLFLLDHRGEGQRGYWYNGQQGMGEIFAETIVPLCIHPDKNCWGERLFAHETNQVYWVKVRMPDGKEGWTDQPWTLEVSH